MDRTLLEEDLIHLLDPLAIERHRATLQAALAVSASPGKQQASAAAYIRDTLRQWDIPVRLHRFTAPAGMAGSAYFSLAHRDAPVPALIMPNSATTPPEGLVAELRPTDLATAPDDGLAGAIAILDGIPTSATVARIAALGAIAQVYVTDNEQATAISDGWGGTVATPVITIGRETGEGFRALATTGPTPVRLKTKTTVVSRRLFLPIGTVAGNDEPDDWIMLGAPGASPAHGANDAACLLELCRGLAAQRHRLRRGVRFAWWPGDPTADTGPVWYGDQVWPELRHHAIAVIALAHLDRSPSGGWQIWSEMTLRSFFDNAWRDSNDQPLTWSDRAVSLPFARLGLPQIHLEPTPAASPGTPVEALATLLPPLARLCTSPLLPFDLPTLAGQIERRIQAIDTTAGDRLDLAPLPASADLFRRSIDHLQLALLHIAQVDSPNYEEGVIIANRVLRQIHRLVMPTLRHAGDPYTTTDAFPAMIVPGLTADTVVFASQTTASPGRGTIIRERNRLLDTLSDSVEAVNDALAALRPLGFG